MSLKLKCIGDGIPMKTKVGVVRLRKVRFFPIFKQNNMFGAEGKKIKGDLIISPMKTLLDILLKL
jgi:hypothetical protein